jgi:membrane-associated phospholipid phosphatase
MSVARRCIEEAGRLDVACYAAIASTPTPTLDRAMAQLSRAANYSRLSLAASGALAVLGGRSGRRAAVSGLSSVAVTSAVVNVFVKPVGRRHRPDRGLHQVPFARRVPMPTSHSFPSGHAAAAFAFAGGAGRVLPAVSLPLHCLAGLVAYSRVHTGVHYPLDVVVGSLIGASLSQVTLRAAGTAGDEDSVERASDPPAVAPPADEMWSA